MVEDAIVKLRRNSVWFEWLKITINLNSIIQLIPFSFAFESGRYVVKTSAGKKCIWALFHFGGGVVFWTEGADMVHHIKTSHDNYQYFDLLHSVGWLIFDYPIMYLWLFKLDRVQEFLDELQDSLIILKHSSRRSAKATGIFMLGVGWYVFTIFMLIPIRWGIFEWSFENYYKALQLACELHLGVSRTHQDHPWYPLAIFVTFIITSYEYNTLLCGDMLAIGVMLTMRDVAVDLDRAIQSGVIDDNEVYELLVVCKRLTRKFNRAFGLLVSIYVVYASPYYALHFVDTIRAPGLMNVLTMPTYALPLCMSCKWAIDILILAKRRKRWLNANGRFLKLDRATCNILLDDITWEKYGLGAYYTVNAFVTGQVFSQIATVIFVRIQSLAREGVLTAKE